ncbi:hypothetical protein [Flavobacterium flavipallidum]|uniref:DUF3828 domain-containing protein n=1 Tax=Flavobacterium flavipallidum TaxID=3139140 RepID=A0ABU9HS05_9FLAO
MKNSLILLFLLLFVTSSHSQKKLSEKEIKFIYTYYYQDFVKKNDFLFRKDTFNDKDYFKKKFNKQEIDNFIKEFEKSAKLEIFKTFDKNALNVTTILSDNFKDVGFENVKISLTDYKLFDNRNDSIKIKFRNDFTTFTPNKINHRSGLVNDTISEKLFDKFHGETTYKLSFLTGYDIITLNLTNIGDTIELGESKYKLIDYRFNKLIIQQLSEKEENIKLINFSIDNKVIKSYAASDFYVMQKQNPALKSKINFSNGKTSGLPAYFYDLFLKNPQMTFDQFKNNLDSYESNPLDKKRIIFHISAIIDPKTKFILYYPKYETRTIQLKKL